jgi:hypothetical protein
MGLEKSQELTGVCFSLTWSVAAKMGDIPQVFLVKARIKHIVIPSLGMIGRAAKRFACRKCLGYIGT